MLIRSLMIILNVYIMLLLSTGCATKVPLTQALLKDYDIHQPELHKLQYYISSRVDLRREQTQIKKGREGGGLYGSSKIIKEHIYVTPNTPGIAVEGDFNELYISFEEGSSFKFSWIPGEIYPDDGRYQLQPKRVIPDDKLTPSQAVSLGSYVFDYRDKEFFSQPTDHIYLIIMQDDLHRIVTKRHRLKGRTINTK